MNHDRVRSRGPSRREFISALGTGLTLTTLGCGRSAQSGNKEQSVAAKQNPRALIDLRTMREPLTGDIRTSLVAFFTKHADTQVSTVGLWGDGFHGTASLHLDTPEHSAAFVEKWVANGPDFYGEDEKGRFCNNCWDFAHCIGEYRLPGYPDLYSGEIDARVDYMTLDGTTERAEADEGDEGKNRIVFPFLKAVFTSLEPFAQLSRMATFRVSVQMRDSRFAHFWSLEIGRGVS